MVVVAGAVVVVVAGAVVVVVVGAGAVVVVVEDPGAFPVETIRSTAEFGATVEPGPGVVSSTTPCAWRESWYDTVPTESCTVPNVLAACASC